MKATVTFTINCDTSKALKAALGFLSGTETACSKYVEKQVHSMCSVESNAADLCRALELHERVHAAYEELRIAKNALAQCHAGYLLHEEVEPDEAECPHCQHLRWRDVGAGFRECTNCGEVLHEKHMR